MAATRRALFPPILNTVSFPTWSADGKTNRKCRKGREVALLHLAVPVFQGAAGLGMLRSKLVQSFPRDDMHIASQLQRTICRSAGSARYQRSVTGRWYLGTESTSLPKAMPALTDPPFHGSYPSRGGLNGYFTSSKTSPR